MKGVFSLDFTFTEEQNMLRKTVRTFVDKEIMPNIAKWDREGAFDPKFIKGWRILG